jgi:hypothetical protein
VPLSGPAYYALRILFLQVVLDGTLDEENIFTNLWPEEKSYYKIFPLSIWVHFLSGTNIYFQILHYELA